MVPYHDGQYSASGYDLRQLPQFDRLLAILVQRNLQSFNRHDISGPFACLGNLSLELIDRAADGGLQRGKIERVHSGVNVVVGEGRRLFALFEDGGRGGESGAGRRSVSETWRKLASGGGESACVVV